MERIVLVCRKQGDHEPTIALLEALFPECAVEIVTEGEDELYLAGDSFENMGSSFQIVPFLGNI